MELANQMETMMTNCNCNPNTNSDERYIEQINQTAARNAARYFSTKVFTIPPEFLEEYFTEYKLKYWQGEFIILQMMYGKIDCYQVIFKTPLTRGYILSHPEEQFAMSFRKAKESTGIDPVVIIALANGKRHV